MSETTKDIRPGILPYAVEAQIMQENERMKVSLRSVRRLAENSAFGGWRFKVAALVDEGLGL